MVKPGLTTCIGMKWFELNTESQTEHTEMTSDVIAERNQMLLAGAVRAGASRYDVERGLIYYHAPPARDGGHVAQESLDYAVALAETRTDLDRVPRIVEETLRTQDQEPHSLTFGNFPWMDNWSRVLDPNAVSFMVPCYYRLLRYHESLLGNELAMRLRDGLGRSAHALLAHRAQWAYGNIFLLNILAKLQVAHVLDDPRLQQIAIWDFEEWFAHTSRFGIVEFNSPVYSAVQIIALEGLLELLNASAIHQQVRAALSMYYTEAFVHFHPASEQFAGAKSRHAPAFRLQCRHLLHALLFRQTGQPQPLDSIDHAGLALSGYSVEKSVCRLAFEKHWPVVVQQSSPHNGLTRRTWMTAQYALGSMSGGRYGRDDVPIEILSESAGVACRMFLEGEPHRFDTYAEQDGGVVVGAVRWRFSPASLRDKRGGPATESLPFRVGFADDYVPADVREVVLTLRFIVEHGEAAVRVGETNWMRGPHELSGREAVCVRAGDVLIGYRGQGSQIVRATEHGFNIEATLAVPETKSGQDVQPFMLCVSEIGKSESENDFFERMQRAELCKSETGYSLRIDGRLDANMMSVHVPESPVTLMQCDDHKLVAGRLTHARTTQNPADAIWEDR